MKTNTDIQLKEFTLLPTNQKVIAIPTSEVGIRNIHRAVNDLNCENLHPLSCVSPSEEGEQISCVTIMRSHLVRVDLQGFVKDYTGKLPPESAVWVSENSENVGGMYFYADKELTTPVKSLLSCGDLVTLINDSAYHDAQREGTDADDATRKFIDGVNSLLKISTLRYLFDIDAYAVDNDGQVHFMPGSYQLMRNYKFKNWLEPIVERRLNDIKNFALFY